MKRLSRFRVGLVLSLAVVVVLLSAGAAARTRPSTMEEKTPLSGIWTGGAAAPQLGNGTLRSEFLVSALRILSMRDSFSVDGFLRHLLRVNDITGRCPADVCAAYVARSLAAAGVIDRKRSPRAGDLVLFRLDPAAATKSGFQNVLIGVVERFSKGRVRFVAPLGAVVGSGIASLGGRSSGKDTILLTCPGPVPRSKVGKDKGRSGKAKASAPKKPCRAGELFLGSVDILTAARTLDSRIATVSRLGR